MQNKISLSIGILIVYLVAANFFLQSRIWFQWFNLPASYSNPAVIVPVAIFINILPLFAFLYAIFYFGKKEQQHREHLMQIGKKAKAKVVSAQDTGITINNNPVVKLTLKIQSDFSEKEQEVTIKKMVPRIAIPRVGDELNIVYDPANIKDLILV